MGGPVETLTAPPVLALSVDVEGFAESHAESVAISREYLDEASGDAEIARNLDVTLQVLADHDCRATFFFLGRIGRSAPQLVHRVAAAGHEIGCHSLFHRRVTEQTPQEFCAALGEAKSLLEDAGGASVIGFRAPEFSIGRGNPWALDALLEAGFRYDSSVVPVSWHNVYGVSGAPTEVFRWPNGMVEFPVPVVRVLGMTVPIGGGGYFRLFPTSWTRRFFTRRDRAGRPTVFYIHPYEIGPEAPRLPGLSPARRFRHYVGLRKGRKRVSGFLSDLRFTTMAEVLTAAGFLDLRRGA